MSGGCIGTTPACAARQRTGIVSGHIALAGIAEGRIVGSARAPNIFFRRDCNVFASLVTYLSSRNSRASPFATLSATPVSKPDKKEQSYERRDKQKNIRYQNNPG